MDTHLANLTCALNRLSLRLLGRHVGKCAGNHAFLSLGLGRARCLRPRRPGSANSSTLTRPSSPTITLSGFRSRCVMPTPCAAATASASGIAISKNLLRGIPFRERKRFAAHELHYDEVDAVGLFDREDLHDVRVVQSRDGLRFPLETFPALG